MPSAPFAAVAVECDSPPPSDHAYASYSQLETLALAPSGRHWYDASDGIPIDDCTDTYKKGAHALSRQICRATGTAVACPKRALVSSNVQRTVAYYAALADVGCKMLGNDYLHPNGIAFNSKTLASEPLAGHGLTKVDVDIDEVNLATVPEDYELLIVPPTNSDGRPYTRSEAVAVAACLGWHHGRRGPLKAADCGPFLRSLGGRPTFQGLVDWLSAALSVQITLYVDRRLPAYVGGAGRALMLQYNTRDNEAMVLLHGKYTCHPGATRLAWSTFGGLSLAAAVRADIKIYNMTTSSRIALKKAATWESQQRPADWADPLLGMWLGSGTKLADVTLADLCGSRKTDRQLLCWYWCAGNDVLLALGGVAVAPRYTLYNGATVEVSDRAVAATWRDPLAPAARAGTAFAMNPPGAAVQTAYLSRYGDLYGRVAADLVHRSQEFPDWTAYVYITPASVTNVLFDRLRQLPAFLKLFCLVNYGPDGAERSMDWFHDKAAVVGGRAALNLGATRHAWATTPIRHRGRPTAVPGRQQKALIDGLAGVSEGALRGEVAITYGYGEVAAAGARWFS